MKKHYLLSIILLLTFTAKGYSQDENYTRDEGKITQFEMSMKEYAPDPDAEAVVFHELGNFYFFPDNTHGFMLTMKFHTKIKILKQAGIEYADFEILYYIGGRVWEEIKDIKATTYNYENGELKKTTLDKSKVYEEKYLNTHRIKKFSMPDVREGSIIEVSYTVITPYYHNMREWKYQKKIPVVYSHLTYKAIPYYEYTYILKGKPKFDIFDKKEHSSEQNFGSLRYREVEYNMGMQNLPAFKDEEFTTSPKDYMTSLNFQLSKIYFSRGGDKTIMSTWPQMCNDFLKYPEFGKYIKSVEKEAKKILPTLDIESKTDTEKLEAISNYVKNMYNWNGVYGKYIKVKNVADFMKQKTGNSADINLFLIGLLKAAKLDAEPVAISTRGNGVISNTHPFETFFNYVLAQVKIGDKTYYVDATESLLHYTALPSRCVNVRGLIVKPNSDEWIFIHVNETATTHKKISIKILPEKAKQEINAEFTAYGNDAFSYRGRYIKDKNDLNESLKKRYNIDIKGDITTENINNRDKPFSFDFAFDQPLETTAEKIFIKPFCGLSIEENIFKQTTRTLPTDLVFLIGDSYECEIEIPAGYKVESTPRSTNISNKIMSINYSAEVSGDKIFVKGKYETNKNIYNPQEYPQLKHMFAAMIERFSEMIVLVKE